MFPLAYTEAVQRAEESCWCAQSHSSLGKPDASHQLQNPHSHHCVISQDKGKVLIPVFALGRAQELCLLLDAFWERTGLTVPIYFSAGLTERANWYCTPKSDSSNVISLHLALYRPLDWFDP